MEQEVFMRPMGDRLVVIPLEEKDVTDSGIIIPEIAKEKPTQGRVVALGPGRGEDNPQEYCSVNDTVLFHKEAGTDIEYEKKGYKVLRWTDVIGIINNGKVQGSQA